MFEATPILLKSWMPNPQQMSTYQRLLPVTMMMARQRLKNQTNFSGSTTKIKTATLIRMMITLPTISLVPKIS